MSEHDATNDDDQGAVDELKIAAEAAQEIRRHQVPRVGTLFRAVILLLLLALLATWQWTRVRTLGPAALGIDPASTVVLTVLPGANYGEAAVFLGTSADGQLLADDAAIAGAVRAAVGDDGKTEVLIQAAGSVVSGEVVKVHDIASAALPAQNNVRVHWSLLPAD